APLSRPIRHNRRPPSLGSRTPLYPWRSITTAIVHRTPTGRNTNSVRRSRLDEICSITIDGADLGRDRNSDTVRNRSAHDCLSQSGHREYSCKSEIHDTHSIAKYRENY